MILCYWGMAASLLCLAMFALTFTPLTASLPQLLMAIVGMGLSLISMFALSSARDIREPEPLAGQRDAPGRIRIA